MYMVENVLDSGVPQKGNTHFLATLYHRNNEDTRRLCKNVFISGQKNTPHSMLERGAGTYSAQV